MVTTVIMDGRILDPTDPYFVLSDEELLERIRAITKSIASGHQQIATPDAGSIGYVSVAAAERILNKLKKSFFKRHGVEVDVAKIRFSKVYVTKDYFE